MMNCQSLQQTLQLHNPIQDSNLWGLVFQNNTVYCDWTNMMNRMIYLQDFQPNLTNPIYQAQIQQQQLDSIFFPVCYAYSVFRIFMVCVVFVYATGKLNEILGEMGKERNHFTIFTQNQDPNVSIINSLAIDINHPNLVQPGMKRIRISSQKHLEIVVYKYTIYFAILLELICALRDFVLFRGMLLFTNMMETYPKVCYMDLLGDNFTCYPDQSQKASWVAFTYSRSECDCLYKAPSEYYYLLDDGGSYMLTAIIIWIISEALTIGVTTFTILTLSRINRKEKSGWSFLRSTIFKSILSTLFCIILFSFVIFYVEQRIYYRFYDQQVVAFYFFWKFLGFVLVFDRLYTKIWLEWKLRFQSLHSHGIDWNHHLNELRRKIYKGFSDNVLVLRANVNPRIQEEFEDFLDSHHLELKKIYEKGLNRYFDDSVKPYILKAEKEAEAKLKTKWYDYLNYMLLMNLIGLVGFAFLVVYGFQLQMDPENNSHSQSLFWIGFTLALVELIVFEISNAIFKLHGFFIELYKNIKQVEAQKDTVSDEDDSESNEKLASN